MLHDAVLNAVIALGGHPDRDSGIRFRNVLVDVVNPLISLPRDLGRFLGNISVSWAAIGEEVDFADLVAIEALRLFRLPVYQAIRSHKTMLCGTSGEYGHQRNQAAAYDAVFLASANSDREREFLRTGLRRLFPRLDSVWSNVHHGSSAAAVWRASRRICDPGHFSTYFRLALGQDVLSRRVLEELLGSLSDADQLKRFFRERGSIVRKDGRSELPIVLDDLIGSANRISKEQAATLMRALFEIADELDLERDEERGSLGFGGNQLRLHWLLNEFVRDRLTQGERSALLKEILPRASLGWAVSLTGRLHSEHYPRQPDRETPMDQRLVDELTLSELMGETLRRLREASHSGELLSLRHFLYILYRWREFAGAASGEVRAWADSQLTQDEFIVRLAAAVTSTAWVTSMGFDGMGDRVSRGVARVQLEGLDTILMYNAFSRAFTK